MDYTDQAVEAVTEAVQQEHDFGGWLSLVLVRAAAQLGSLNALTAGRPGSWESALVDQLARGLALDDDDLAAYAAGKDHAMSATYDHSRVDVATQRAALAVARALLNGDPQTAATATLGASCPVCLALTSVHLSFGLAAEAVGETGWPVSDELRLRMLHAIEATERELRAAPN
jgi:hypothetical protein